MDHAHLLQCSGRNLRRLHGRSRPTPSGSSSARKIYRPSLPSPRQHHHSHLHRRLALLRRKSLARLPEHPPPYLILSPGCDFGHRRTWKPSGFTASFPFHSISPAVILAVWLPEPLLGMSVNAYAFLAPLEEALLANLLLFRFKCIQ